MTFWFNKWYSKQRTDYNAVVRLILVLSFRLPDSHSPASVFARSRFSTHTVFSIPLSFPALSRTCSENAHGQGHAGLFHETIHLKGPTTHWCTRRCRGSRDIVYGSADILGLLPMILHKYIKQIHKNVTNNLYLFFFFVRGEIPMDTPPLRQQ